MPEPQNGAELLARIKPQLRVESCQIVLRPDLIEEWEQADAELGRAKTADAVSKRLASGESETTRELAKKVQKLEAKLLKHSVTFTFQAIPKDAYRALCEQHPPRKKNDLDSMVGMNRDEVADSLVRLCLIDPVFDDVSWAEFLKVCNPSEWAELRHTAETVNRSVVDVPKSLLASQVLGRRARGSAPRARGE